MGDPAPDAGIQLSEADLARMMARWQHPCGNLQEDLSGAVCASDERWFTTTMSLS